MKAISRTISSTGLDSSNKKMEQHIRAHSKWGFSMEKVISGGTSRGYLLWSTREISPTAFLMDMAN